jgi:hypothetical protein
MEFKKCACCGLELPLHYLLSVQINHQGRLMSVLICTKCKELKEAESKRRQNESNA